MIHLLGITLLRSRYARSKFGQLWLTLSTLVFIFSIGVIWSLLWKQPLDQYLPYIGVSQIMFTFLVAIINDSTNVLISDARIYKNDRAPFLLSIIANLYKNILILLHNVPVIIGLLIWSNSVSPSFSIWWLLSLAIVLIFTTLVSFVVAIICSRFRDFTHLVTITTQISLMASPVMWYLSLIPERYRDYLFINPMTVILELLRNPIVGLAVPKIAYLGIMIWLVIAIVLFLAVYRKYSRKIIFWI